MAVGSATVDSVGFTAKTLSPTRYSAYAKVTEQMLAQSADDMGAFIAADIRKAVEAKFNADIISAIETATIANFNDGGGTPDLKPFAAATMNPLHLEEQLLKDDVDLANIRCLASATAFRKARTLSLDAGSGLLFAATPAERRSVIGYDTVISSGVNAGDLFMMDQNQLVMGTWGGVNIMVDPYTDANNGVIRIIANVYKSFQTLQAQGFVGLEEMQ